MFKINPETFLRHPHKRKCIPKGTWKYKGPSLDTTQGPFLAKLDTLSNKVASTRWPH